MGAMASGGATASGGAMASGGAQGGGGAACAGSPDIDMAGGQPAMACTPAGQEICDGIDNDCDGAVDNDCVAALSVVFQEQLKPLGDANGGGPFVDNCPRGEVLAGLQVRMGSHLSQIQGLCRELVVTPSDKSTSGYVLAVSAAPPLPAHPEMSADGISTLLCNAGQGLVGFRSALQDIPFPDADGVATVTTRIWVSCAKLALVRRSSGALGIQAAGASVELAPASGSSAKDSDLVASVTVPVGTLPTRLFGASGLWVDRVGIGLSELQLAQ
jgi:hypothetical protein